MRGLGRFRNSHQAFAQGVKIPRLFASLAVRHMAICGKIVDYISGHKQDAALLIGVNLLQQYHIRKY